MERVRVWLDPINYPCAGLPSPSSPPLSCSWILAAPASRADRGHNWYLLQTSSQQGNQTSLHNQQRLTLEASEDCEPPLSAYNISDICCFLERGEVLTGRAVRQRRAGAAITQLHTQEKKMETLAICRIWSWPVLDSHLGPRVTQPTDNIGHKYLGLRHQSSGNHFYNYKRTLLDWTEHLTRNSLPWCLLQFIVA